MGIFYVLIASNTLNRILHFITLDSWVNEF